MKKLILVFILIQLLFSCSSRKNIPEITPHLNAHRMREISISPDILTVIAVRDSILLPDIKGNIDSFSDEKKKPVTLFKFASGLKKQYLRDNNILVLSASNKKNIIFFDLESNKVIYESNKYLKIKSVKNPLFLHVKRKKLEIFNFIEEKTIFSKTIDRGKLIDSDISNNEVVFLFEKSLLIYNIKNDSESEKELKVKPVSPFLRLGDYLYFGDDSRALVKFSLKNRKIIWKYRFQKHLKIKPSHYNGLIIVSPEDNNTYLITQKGGVKDWYISESGRLFNPVLMKDHLAVFLRTNKGTSINYYGLKNHSMSTFKDKNLTLRFGPVYFRNNLFSAGIEGDDPLLKLIKIGNKFGTTIKLNPESGHEAGKSIRFQISPVNMYKADIVAVIYNEKREKVFSRQIPFNNNPSFAWVPESGGDFTLEVTTKEKDGIETTDIKKLIITDTSLMYKNLQMKIHRKCGENGKKTENKNEKSD
ncbi:MAG: hypothetical protein ABFR36_08205 [Acidobacteriota bacterium]